MKRKEIKTEDGKTRFSVKCRACKVRFIETANIYHEVGDSHSCETWDKFAAVIGQIGRHGLIQRWHQIDRIFTVEPVRGRFVEGKVCDGRCMGAVGPNCECSCGGQNHGAGR